MKKTSLILLSLFFQISFGQVRKINGIIIDNTSGKKSAISVCVSENSNSAELKGCLDAKADGSFEIPIPDHLKKPPYKLTVIVIGLPKKEYLIYDTTKLPFKIVLENAQSVYEKLDKPKYDPAVKLRKFEHSESDGDHNTQKTFKRNSNSETHELTLIYNASCGQEFKPTVKFVSDTLFIESNKGKASTGDKCSCESKLFVSGLKTKKYTVLFNGEALIEKE